MIKTHFRQCHFLNLTNHSGYHCCSRLMMGQCDGLCVRYYPRVNFITKLDKNDMNQIKAKIFILTCVQTSMSLFFSLHEHIPLTWIRSTGKAMFSIYNLELTRFKCLLTVIISRNFRLSFLYFSSE